MALGRATWLLTRAGVILLTRFPFWNAFSTLMLYGERASSNRKPDLALPFLYVDMAAAVICATFMSYGMKRRWFALGAALQLSISYYLAVTGGHAHYPEWQKVRMLSRVVALVGGFLVLASGAGESYRQKERVAVLQRVGQIFLGIHLFCQAYALQHSTDDRAVYGAAMGWELLPSTFVALYSILALCLVAGWQVQRAGQLLAILLPPVTLLTSGNMDYWHGRRKFEFWGQLRLAGFDVGILGAMLVLASEG
uniref:transmembrane protein 101 isoform X1 n=2 Tax=Myxine glutinosa TaxID=7769 RepID=UPI00358F540E